MQRKMIIRGVLLISFVVVAIVVFFILGNNRIKSVRKSLIGQTLTGKNYYYGGVDFVVDEDYTVKFLDESHCDISYVGKYVFDSGNQSKQASEKNVEYFLSGDYLE